MCFRTRSGTGRRKRSDCQMKVFGLGKIQGSRISERSEKENGVMLVPVYKYLDISLCQQSGCVALNRDFCHGGRQMPKETYVESQ